MSKIFGTNERLIVEDKPDSDSELEISMSVMANEAQDESVTTWINRNDAIELIEHLKKAFNLKLR